ncbi:MAG: Flp family type IVb pilin [Desulfurivibrionaceae bacterium]|nr:Flp family type IVb pilin [Desulfurivibrionaceae bacterium]
MSQLCQVVRKFVKEEKGATVVEYAVLIALIITGCIAIIATFGGQIQTCFDSVLTEWQKVEN